MKKYAYNLLKGTLFFIFLLSTILETHAQAGTAVLITVSNMVQSGNTFTYDVYCTNTGTTTLAIRGYSWGLNHTPGLSNGGTISQSFISRDPLLAGLPLVNPSSNGYTASSSHIRGTTVNAAAGNEVLLTTGVPIRLATMQLSNTVLWPSNFNPFLPSLPFSPIQVISAPGRTQCLMSMIVTPPGTSYVINGTPNVGALGTLQNLTAQMIPSPTGTNPFILNCSCLSSITTYLNLTACDSYTWPLTGQTYTSNGVYTAIYPNVFIPGLFDTTYLTLTINYSSSNTSTTISCEPYTWINGATYTMSGIYTYTALSSSGCDSIVTLMLTLINGVKISPKVLLSGAYAGAGMMQDSLRVKGVLPLMEPYTALNFTPIGCPGYTGGETTTAAMFAVSGNNAIVDWVNVEIRSPNLSYSKVATQNALLQRDGQIVDVNGGPLNFNCVCPGSYFVTVKHRNHLGVMSGSTITLSNLTQLIDFTTSTPVWLKPAAISAPRENDGIYRLLWPGDTRTDKNTRYSSVNNDKEAILIAIGIATPNNTLSPVYRTEDVNMDGRVKYNNAENDKNFMLNKILHSNSPVSSPNTILMQHTPN